MIMSSVWYEAPPSRWGFFRLEGVIFWSVLARRAVRRVLSQRQARITDGSMTRKTDTHVKRPWMELSLSSS
jgi:hypothetical protein